MFKTLLAVVVLFISFSSKSAIVIWDGGGSDGLWSTAANWNGNAQPTTGDDVILDNSMIAGTYSVEFPGGLATVVLNSFTISPSLGNVITFRIPNANTANPAFSVTGPGNAVLLNSGSVFINSSGLTRTTGGTSVTVSTTNFFRINNGAKYIHNTSSGHTTNLAARLSTATGTENGIFEFDIPGGGSNTISLSGRTYGTLRLSSAASGGTITYIGSGINPLTINRDLQINSGVIFSISMTGNVIVKGNYVQQAGSVFNIQSSMTAGVNNIVRLMGNVESAGTITESGAYQPIIEFGGTLNQDIKITGSILNDVSFSINNPAGATLSAPLSIPFRLQLVNGKIKTNSTYILRMLDNAVYSGGSTSSFIEGPMIKVGDDPSFTFPVGKGSIYAPIRFNTSGLLITDEFQAEYHRQNPQNIYGTNYEIPFDHISYVEYWSLNKTVGTLSSPVSVSLPVTEYSFAHVMNSTYLTRYNNGDAQWKNSGTSTRVEGTPVPPNITGTITSVPLNEIGIFSLATTDPFITNPLPLKIISFEAIKTTERLNKINWEIAGEFNGIVLFEMQRSYDGKNFNKIQSQYSSLNKSGYSATDREVNETRTWYRLKMLDKDGNVVYSKTVYVDGTFEHFFITVVPNPSQADAALFVYSGVKRKIVISIYDITGKQISIQQSALNNGKNKIALPVADLPPGIFTIVVSDYTDKKALRFVKL